jgi:hypothetical protein
LQLLLRFSVRDLIVLLVHLTTVVFESFDQAMTICHRRIGSDEAMAFRIESLPPAFPESRTHIVMPIVIAHFIRGHRVTLPRSRKTDWCVEMLWLAIVAAEGAKCAPSIRQIRAARSLLHRR